MTGCGAVDRTATASRENSDSFARGKPRSSGDHGAIKFVDGLRRIDAQLKVTQSSRRRPSTGDFSAAFRAASQAAAKVSAVAAPPASTNVDSSMCTGNLEIR